MAHTHIDGFLLWVRIAYACPTIASLCNTRITLLVMDFFRARLGELLTDILQSKTTVEGLASGGGKSCQKSCHSYAMRRRSQDRGTRNLACTNKDPTQHSHCAFKSQKRITIYILYKQVQPAPTLTASPPLTSSTPEHSLCPQHTG